MNSEPIDLRKGIVLLTLFAVSAGSVIAMFIKAVRWVAGMKRLGAFLDAAFIWPLAILAVIGVALWIAADSFRRGDTNWPHRCGC